MNLKLVTLKNNKTIYFLFLFFIFLLFTKIDYRISEPNSAGIDDDVSYYFHSKTLAQDFDLDYSNQIDQGIKTHYLNEELGTYVPRHPFGSGLLASPFLAFGMLLENFFNLKNFSYFIYSLSAIFYLFFSFFLLSKILLNESQSNLFILIISFFGSGISYYAFERFSMTHVYEVFSISVIFYFCNLIHTCKNKMLENLFVLLIGIFSFVFLSIRWTNYFLFLIPILYFSINENIPFYKSKFLRNKYYYLGFTLGLSAFLIHTKLIYGFYTLNPSQIYSSESIINNIPINIEQGILINIISLTVFSLKSFFTILFSFEFGLFFISPIIFLIYVSCINFMFKKQFLNALLIFLILLIPTGTVVAWQTTASSFGFRYLFCLIPVGMFVVYKSLSFNFVLNYLRVFGVFSLVSVLFFETNSMTILQAQTNSFGTFHDYSAPNYVIGVFYSVFSINSYLKIIFTSYLGVLFFKFLNLISIDSMFLEKVEQLGYLNEDVMRVYNYSTDFYYANYFIFLLLFLLMTKKLYKPTLSQ
jgi:hypothetical protein